MGKVTEQQPRPSLVRSLMDPSPTLLFNMERKGAEEGDFEDHPFRVRVLRAIQNIDVLSASQRVAKEKKELEGYTDIYKEAQASELVARAMLKPDPVENGDGTVTFEPYFVGGDQVRASLDEAEIAQIVDCYLLTVAHFDLDPLTEEDVEEMLEGLANEMTQTFFLKRVSSREWPALIYLLAKMLVNTRRTLRSYVGTSESESATTGPGTSSFSKLPAARSKEYGEMPTEELLNPESAREMKRQRKRRKQNASKKSKTKT